MRTRTVISQAHTYQWLGTFGNRGNGRYREELRKDLAAITRYLVAHQLPKERILPRLDGQYGMGAILFDLADFAEVPRGKFLSRLVPRRCSGAIGAAESVGATVCRSCDTNVILHTFRSSDQH